MSYTGRLIFGTVLVLLVTLILLVLGVDRALRGALEDDVRRSLERQAAVVRDALRTGSGELTAHVASLARAGQVRITVADSAGRVLADFDGLDSLPVRSTDTLTPEILTARRGGVGTAIRRVPPDQERVMFVAIPSSGGVVRLAMPLDQIGGILASARRPIALGALLALALGIGLAILSGRHLARPLAETSEAARAIARGQPPAFPWSGIRDVDRLVVDLRDMHRQLGDRYEALRRRQAETAAIVDAMVEGVLSSDARGRIVTANPAARRLLGYAPADPLPELPLLFRAREARELVLAALRGEQAQERETEIGERICLVNALPLSTGGAVVVLHDLTRLRRLETVRRDFVANVSHELKTPLTAISGYAETLLGDDLDPATNRRFLETILSNARRMQRLVDDQLDLARIESGRWSPRPTALDLESAFREAWMVVQPKTGPAPRFEIEAEPGAKVVHADADALRQVLRNLFENALRHTPPDGMVRARSRRDGSGIRLIVADTGAGIANEHLPRIFERFYRVDPGRSREHGGTGLGLAIVRHLVEAHGGRVSAESELGQGTEIHCWLPEPPVVTES